MRLYETIRIYFNLLNLCFLLRYQGEINKPLVSGLNWHRNLVIVPLKLGLNMNATTQHVYLLNYYLL